MKIIRITDDNEISVHDFPDGTHREQNAELQKLIGSKCDMCEHVRPKRLYTELGGSGRVDDEPGSSVSMLVDEDGIYHDLKENLVGSYLYETDKHGHSILGNILIIGEVRKWGMGIDFCGISEQQFNLLYPKLEELVKKARDFK